MDNSIPPPPSKPIPLPLPTSIYVTDERKPVPGLRYRNRSNDRFHYQDKQGHYPNHHGHYPDKNGHYPENVGYPRRDSGVHSDYSFSSPTAIRSEEDGFDEESPSWETPIFSVNGHTNYRDLEDSETIWDMFQRRLFSRSRRSLFSSQAPKPMHLDRYLPLIVVLILVGSCVFTVFTLRRSVDAWKGREVQVNGKHMAIEYGQQQRLERMKREGKLNPEDLRDENGEVLGGKRNSIQYAYEIAKDGETEGKTDDKVETAEPEAEAEVPEVEVIPSKPEVETQIESPEKAVKSSEEAVESPEKAVESPKKAVKFSEKAVELPEKAVKSPEKAVESPEKAVKSSGEAVESHGKANTASKWPKMRSRIDESAKKEVRVKPVQNVDKAKRKRSPMSKPRNPLVNQQIKEEDPFRFHPDQ